MEEFYLDEYLAKKGSLSNRDRPQEERVVRDTPKTVTREITAKTVRDTVSDNDERTSFKQACEIIYREFGYEWEHGGERPEKLLELQKKAITGYAPEVAFFKSKIREYLEKHKLTRVRFPVWYQSLEDGIYHENWGVASIAEWFDEEHKSSSSAKIIGDRVYFLENGKMTLKPQRIEQVRREQLIRSFLMLTPEERLDKDFHEVYLLDGTRITIFRRAMVKKGQDVIIFRRYVVPSYTFEEQAMRGTIPQGSVPFFEAMAKLGYNVAFTGAVRTAKSTFLSTWQAYEKEELEGVMIETDPEIPMEKLMPRAPVVQLLADGERLAAITKNLLRSDADYFIMAEARDGIALETVLRAAAKGTRRMKITFHARDPLNFPYDVASEIVHSVGGDLERTARQAASSFDYVFHFIQLADKSKKRLRSIHELSYDRTTNEIRMVPICRYRRETDDWVWSNRISEEKREMGQEDDVYMFRRFAEELARLAEKHGEDGERRTADE